VTRPDQTHERIEPQFTDCHPQLDPYYANVFEAGAGSGASALARSCAGLLVRSAPPYSVALLPPTTWPAAAVAGPRDWAGIVVLRDRPADHNTGAGRQLRQRRVQNRAPHVVKVDVNALQAMPPKETDAPRGSVHISVGVWRPPLTRATLCGSPLVEARRAHSSCFKRIPLIAAATGPEVFLAGRPAAERGSECEGRSRRGFSLERARDPELTISRGRRKGRTCHAIMHEFGGCRLEKILYSFR